MFFVSSQIDRWRDPRYLSQKVAEKYVALAKKMHNKSVLLKRGVVRDDDDSLKGNSDLIDIMVDGVID